MFRVAAMLGAELRQHALFIGDAVARTDCARQVTVEMRQEIEPCGLIMAGSWHHRAYYPTTGDCATGGKGGMMVAEEGFFDAN